MLIDTANMAAALRADEDEAIDPATATALYDFATTAIGGGLATAFAVFVAAVSLVALRRLLLPRWLGWIGLAVALILLAGPVAFVALLFLLPLWVLGVGILLYLRWPPPVGAEPA